MRTITKIFAAALCAAVALPMSAQVEEGRAVLKNVSTGLYWAPGNNWGTRASLMPSSEYVTLHDNGDGTFQMETQVSNGGTAYYFNGSYMDNGEPVNLTFTQLPNGKYTIDCDGNYYGKGTEAGSYQNSLILGDNLDPNSEDAQWEVICESQWPEYLATATEKNPIDITFLILNPNFGRNNRNTTAWTMVASNKNLSGGTNENRCAESWRAAFNLSQTITGLPDGVYQLRAQAALTDYTNAYDGVDYPVVYANSSQTPFNNMEGDDIGSSMTKMSNSFAQGLYEVEPIEFYVIDGTVTIGVLGTRTDTWCIWDNFRLTYLTSELPLEAYAEVFANTQKQAQELLDSETYANVTGSERDDLKEAMAANPTDTKKGYSDATADLNKAMNAFRNALGSYNNYLAAIEMVSNYNKRSFPYAADEYIDAIADAKELLSPSSAAQAQGFADDIYAAVRGAAESNVLAEGVDATDITELIVNPDAEEAIADPWFVELGEGSGGSLGILSGEPWTDGSGNSEHRYFDGGNWGATAWDVKQVQDITLPKGKYFLSAMARASAGLDTFVLFAGENTTDLAHIGAAGGLFNFGWDINYVEFSLDEETTLGIGVQGVTTSQYQWMSFSKFRLVQLEGDKVTVGIEMVATEQPADARIYNLQGQQVKNAQKGLFIVNGKKVIR